MNAPVDAGPLDAGPVDAGTFSVIYSECPEVDFGDGGHAPLAFPVELRSGLLFQVQADGGNDYYLPYPRPQRIGCRLDACEERVRDLEVGWNKQAPIWVVISTATSMLLSGFFAARYVCGKFPALCR